MIIDFHTHTFPAAVSQRVIETLSRQQFVAYFTDASVDGLAAAIRAAGIDYAVNLPVMTREDQVTRVNASLIRQKEELLSRGIVTFGGLHPDFLEYRQELRRLREAGIRGIKLHPELQQVSFRDIRCKRILAAAEEEGLMTLIHCGPDNHDLSSDHASVADILEVLRDVDPRRLILAHMGGWQHWQEVEQYLAGAPVYLDTAYSLGPVYPRAGAEDRVTVTQNLSDSDFVRLVRLHGADRVLFATDSPWVPQDAYVKFLRDSALTDSEKTLILGENARRLLGL